MPRYAAFLRGINVGGTRITKERLCEPFTALGLESVTTFRASGNVIFDARKREPDALARQIEKRLAADLGFTRAITFVRSAEEMRALAAAEPLPVAPGGKLHVMLLQRAPDAAVLDYALPGDELALGPRELFWATKGRMMDSQLDLKAIEKLIGPTTVRTKATIDQIAARFFL